MSKYNRLIISTITVLIFAVGVASLFVFASDSRMEGYSTLTTPFDRKLSSVGVFDTTSLSSQTQGQASMENLFMTARQFRYTKDFSEDQWQTLAETEARRSGDCEDKAIWLYFKLKQNGYSNVRLVIGRYRSLDPSYHVWLTYTDNENVAYLLDPTIQKRIWRLSDFSSDFYHPRFSYDGNQRYQYLPS